MNVMPVSNPYAPRLPQNSPAHLRDIARRRWTAQREQERRRDAVSAIDHLNRIRRLRPGRSVASSRSPVYGMFSEFSEALFRAR